MAAKPFVTGAGFLLNNEMDDFSIKPGVPNLFGVTGQAANAIVPGKNAQQYDANHCVENNKPVIITGSPGGSTIPTSVFQTIVNLIDFSLSPEDAVNMPKFHHQWTPDQVDVEKNFLTCPFEKWQIWATGSDNYRASEGSNSYSWIIKGDASMPWPIKGR